VRKTKKQKKTMGLTEKLFIAVVGLGKIPGKAMADSAIH